MYEDGNLFCEAGFQIKIEEALFGRVSDPVNGNQVCATYPEGSCSGSLDVTELAKAECENKQSCTFHVAGNTAGAPCTTVQKYTRVVFSCVPQPEEEVIGINIET